MQQEPMQSQFFNNFQPQFHQQPQEIQEQSQSQNIKERQFQERTNQINQMNNLLNINPNQNNINMDLNSNNINNNSNNNNFNVSQNDTNSNNNSNNTINVINNNNNSNQNDNNQVSENNKTKLENKFSFWYRISDDIAQYQGPKQALDKKIYETQVKKIHEFDTVEDFWGIFQHLRKPDSCRPGIEFMMFKEPIIPMWEDENNKNGGKISIKLRKQFTTIIWEEMIFALIGGILPKEMKEEINGIVVTSRKEFNTLQIWFKTFDERITNDLQECIRGLLVIPDEVILEIKQFNKNKKENNNEKKTTGYYNNKGYNYSNNYYDDGYDKYKEEKNQYKKNNKHHNYNNKNK